MYLVVLFLLKIKEKRWKGIYLYKSYGLFLEESCVRKWFIEREKFVFK